MLFLLTVLTFNQATSVSVDKLKFPRQEQLVNSTSFLFLLFPQLEGFLTRGSWFLYRMYRILHRK